MPVIKKHYPVVALAGRRTDAEGADTEKRFPVENIHFVKQRLRKLFEESRPDALVSSAAAGADLLAIEMAGKMGIRRRIVLPIPAQEFRKDSVADRGEAWGELFDEAVKSSGDVVSMGCVQGDLDTYLAGNERILDEALKLSAKISETSKDGVEFAVQNVLAVLVWDGSSRGTDDVTASFKDSATARGIDVVSINTLDRDVSG